MKNTTFWLSRIAPVMILSGGLGLLALLPAGCASSPASPQSDYSDPTTRALNDPMNYSPNMNDPDISGGGLGDFHDKSFKRDVDHVLNP